MGMLQEVPCVLVVESDVLSFREPVLEYQP